MRRAVGSTAAPLVLWILVAAAAWLGYGRTDLTLDEGYTLVEAKLPFGELLEVLARRELNGSLHTVLVWTLHLGAAPDWAVRLLSCVLAAALSVVLFTTLRRFGTVPALVGTAVTLLNADVMFNVVNGRGYVLALLLVALGLALLLRSVDGGSWRVAAAFGVVSGLGLYAHFFTAPVLAAELVWVIVVHPRTWRLWPAAAAPLAVLSLPLVWFFASGGGGAGQLPFVPDKSWHDYVSGVTSLIAGGADGRRLVQALAVLLVGATVLAGLARRRSRAATALGVGALALLLAVAMLASGSQPHIYNPRYLSVGLPMLGLALAAGLSAVGRPRPRAALAAGLSVVAVTASALAIRDALVVSETDRHPWTEAAHFLGNVDPGATVTTMVPFEGAVARREMSAETPSLQFVPPPPSTAREMLGQSGYDEKTCLPAAAGWVLTTMSPHLEQVLPGAARCAGLVALDERTFGPVRVFRLVGDLEVGF